MGKNSLLVVMIGLLLAIGSIEASAQAKKTDKETVVFEVSMSCQNCEKKIEKNISFEKGVTDLIIDLKEKTVTIEYQVKKTNKDKLKAAIEKLGFQAEEIKEEI